MPVAIVVTLVIHYAFYKLLQVPLPWGVLQGIAWYWPMDALAWPQAFALVFDPYNICVMLAASLFGLFVGAVPGLTATMATALLVPVTFFMAPIPAIAAIVTATAMAIFSGDIPGCLMRMPGTPASAAYTDEAYAMTRKGQAETGAGRGPRVLGDRRPVRHGGADPGRRRRSPSSRSSSARSSISGWCCSA